MATNEKVEYGIPQVYMFEVNTDGSITKDGSCTFCNVSYNLVKDLQEVLYSLSIS